MTEIIGRHRARVTLRQPVRTSDDLGGASVAYSDAGAAWAEIEPRGGSSGAALDGPQAQTRYRLTLRGPYDVLAGWRVIWAGRTLKVERVEPVDAARVAFDCVEENL